MIKTIGNLDAYRNLYNSMLNGLAQLDESPDEGIGYYPHLSCVKGKMAELKELFVTDFGSQQEEIIYFREIWPQFYGRFFYYVLLQRFWLKERAIPIRRWKRLVRCEERRAAAFFQRYQQFWINYRVGGAATSSEFTRAHSIACVYDPLSFLLDAAGATLASYRAAWGLAYEDYLKWLRRIDEDASADNGEGFEWRESKSAAAELIKSQAEAQSIYINGKPASASQLRADFERRYGLDLKGFDRLLYAADIRKIEETPYLSKLINSLLGRKRRLRK